MNSTTIYRKFNILTEKAAKKIDPIVKVDGATEPVLSPELKIKHKESGILYTVDQVGNDEVVLRTPEGEQIVIDNDTLEREYVL